MTNFCTQAVAAAHVAGKPNIVDAAESGDIGLVWYQFISDPSCVHQQGLR
jgi:hypothetical protein